MHTKGYNPMCQSYSPIHQRLHLHVCCRCVFGLKRVLLQLAGDQAFAPFFDLNDKAHACRATGFLPLHAVVANSRDFGPLRDSLPPYSRLPLRLTPSHASLLLPLATRVSPLLLPLYCPLRPAYVRLPDVQAAATPARQP